MMKKRNSFLSTIIFMTVLFTLALAPNFNGKWTTTIQSPNGEIQLTFTFKVNGDSLSGTVASDMGAFPISKGIVNGNKISFDVSFNGNTIEHHGTIAGDSINLQVEGAMGGDFNMVLKRAPGNNSKDN